jgi:hypothetical protein
MNPTEDRPLEKYQSEMMRLRVQAEVEGFGHDEFVRRQNRIVIELGLVTAEELARHNFPVDLFQMPPSEADEIQDWLTERAIATIRAVQDGTLSREALDVRTWNRETVTSWRRGFEARFRSRFPDLRFWFYVPLVQWWLNRSAVAVLLRRDRVGASSPASKEMPRRRGRG